MNELAASRSTPTQSDEARKPTTRRLGRLARWDVSLVGGAVLAAGHASGVLGDVPMMILSIVTPVTIALGVWMFRPTPRYPWVMLIVAGVSWSIAGAIRAAVGSTGDLSVGRNVTPDLFAIAGYVLFAMALLSMLRAQGQAARSRTLGLDGGIMALSALLVFWVGLIAPVLFRLEAAPIAKVSIVVYPPISAVLVWIAARLAFGSVSRGYSHSLLLAGMLALLLGDIAYIPLETQVVERAPGRLLELPYALAYALIGAAALHPSMRDTVRRKTIPKVRSDSRLALVATALMTPALVLLVWSPSSMTERVVVGLIAVALAVTATTRVTLAARTQATVEQRLALQASSDELTGLLNRPAVHELLNRQLDEVRARDEPLALLFIDLDRFKMVNDTYGHAVGDELLLAAADRLRTSIGPDDVVARLSGDEFLVVLPRTDARRAKELASRICDEFAVPFELMGTAWVTASIGVVVTDFSCRDLDAASLIRDADTAMYAAKRVGRAGYSVFDPSMRTQSERQLELYNGLHLAVERDEFDVYYQAIVDSATGAVRGVEALVRWFSPDGLVPPDEWISLAEDSHLIAPIGEGVLRQACAQVARWRRLPGCSHLTLSVNVSGRQIIDVDLVKVVADAIDDSGLDPHALWLEITESVILTDTLDTLATLAGMREIGVHLSVDDFGTGYSSLSYLQRYPVEQVKIDRQFVAGMCEHSEDAAVVSAIVGIADALGLSVVAEGVETTEQAEALRRLGCSLLQGYLFSAPVAALDVGPILIEKNQIGSPPGPNHRWR